MIRFLALYFHFVMVAIFHLNVSTSVLCRVIQFFIYILALILQSISLLLHKQFQNLKFLKEKVFNLILK